MYCLSRYGYLEEQLNKESIKKLPKLYSELILDLVKLVHKRRTKIVTNDCLIPICKKLMKNIGKEQKLVVKKTESKSCPDSICKGSENFQNFVSKIQPFLSNNPGMAK